MNYCQFHLKCHPLVINQLWQSKIRENSPFINDVHSYSINFHLGPTKNKMVGIQVDQSVLGAAHPNAWGILLDCCRSPEQPHSAGGLNHEHLIYWCFMFQKKTNKYIPSPNNIQYPANEHIQN